MSRSTTSGRAKEGEPPPLVSPRRINGWLVLYLPEFATRFVALAGEVERLRERLAPDEYRKHDTVKLLAGLIRLVREIIPASPDEPRFQLRGNLARFRRAKGLGLPPRYRLFWVFSETHRTIVFLYLNDETTLRKEGARTDPYAVFSQLVERGVVGSDFSANLALWRRAYPAAQLSGTEGGAGPTPRQRRRRQ